MSSDLNDFVRNWTEWWKKCFIWQQIVIQIKLTFFGRETFKYKSTGLAALSKTMIAK